MSRQHDSPRTDGILRCNLLDKESLTINKILNKTILKYKCDIGNKIIVNVLSVAACVHVLALEEKSRALREEHMGVSLSACSTRGWLHHCLSPWCLPRTRTHEPFREGTGTASRSQPLQREKESLHRLLYCSQKKFQIHIWAAPKFLLAQPLH